ncbi:MAG TPA: hypothetical protein VIP56_07430 [Nitrososphaeraceae archaeon]
MTLSQLGSDVPLFIHVRNMPSCGMQNIKKFFSPKRKSFCCDRAQRISVLIEYPMLTQMAIK